jgi:hypothetical protein
MASKFLEAYNNIFKQTGIIKIEGIMNPVRIIGPVSLLYFVSNRGIETIMVDTNMLNYISVNKMWTVTNSKDRLVFCNNLGSFYMASFLLGVEQDRIIKHKDKNTLDCRLENLIVTDQLRKKKKSRIKKYSLINIK